MIEKIKKIYYCEHCKKKRLFIKSAMEKHEKRCTMNLDRECSFCGRTDNLRDLIDKFKGRINECFSQETPTYSVIARGKIKELIDDIRDEVENCPACTLAIIRNVFIDRMWATRDDFNYEQEKTAWWKNNSPDSVMPGFDGE